MDDQRRYNKILSILGSGRRLARRVYFSLSNIDSKINKLRKEIENIESNTNSLRIQRLNDLLNNELLADSLFRDVTEIGEVLGDKNEGQVTFFKIDDLKSKFPNYKEYAMVSRMKSFVDAFIYRDREDIMRSKSIFHVIMSMIMIGGSMEHTSQLA